MSSYARMSVEELRRGPLDDLYVLRWPELDWYAPMHVGVLGSRTRGLGCRLCIAKFGLAGSDVGKLPQTLEEFAAHVREVHR